MALDFSIRYGSKIENTRRYIQESKSQFLNSYVVYLLTYLHSVFIGYITVLKTVNISFLTDDLHPYENIFPANILKLNIFHPNSEMAVGQDSSIYCNDNFTD